MSRASNSLSASRPRVLVFCRNYLIPDFRANVESLGAAFEFRFLTDGACRGVADTRRAFYRALRSQAQPDWWSQIIESDVIERCRLLRKIDRNQAARMARAMGHVLTEAVDETGAQVVLCHWVDEYILHLLSILCGLRGIGFLAYASSYFPGYVQIVRDSRGHPLDVREPDPLEIRKTLDAVTPQEFRQDYAQLKTYTPATHAWRVLRYRLKRVVFTVKAVLERDPWNLHYAVTPYIAERRSLRHYPNASHFAADWRERISRQQRGLVVYLPLTYFPEATTDYWIQDRSIIDYEESILRICRMLAESATVVVKEHFHMLGARDPSFYERLNAVEGLVQVPPAEISNRVLSECDAVVVGAGSVGVEAFLRDKPIFSYCDSSYWFSPAEAEYLDLREPHLWAEQIRAGVQRHEARSVADKERFIGACLRSTVRARPGGRRWVLMHPNDLCSLLPSLLPA